MLRPVGALLVAFLLGSFTHYINSDLCHCRQPPLQRQDNLVMVTHMMAICSGHLSSGGGGGAAPMMVGSSASPGRRRGDEARPRLQPPPMIDELIFFHQL
ncbi:hypothetical protein VPH35_124134 [Triticum aestivum]